MLFYFFFHKKLYKYIKLHGGAWHLVYNGNVGVLFLIFV